MILVAKPCAFCSTDFMPRTYNQIYCTNSCSNRAEDRKRRAYKRAWDKARYRKDPAANKARHDKWYWANRDHVRRYRRMSLLREKYGVTLDQVDAMLTAQGGLCALCGRSLPVRLHIDNDHETGVVRGLLHDQCNRGLSLFADNLERVEQAAIYLRKHLGGN